MCEMACNTDIREAAIRSGIKLWQIADRLGVTDSTFSRKLRKELDLESKKRIMAIVSDIAEENDQKVG